MNDKLNLNNESYKASIGLEKITFYDVTAKDIKRFSQAIGENNQIHYDEEYAQGKGYATIVAPSLFCQSLTYDDVPVDELGDDGSPAEINVDIPAKRAVGGSSDYEINRLVLAGERIKVISKLKDVYKKEGRSGELYFIEVETSFEGAESNDLIAKEMATYIKR